MSILFKDTFTDAGAPLLLNNHLPEFGQPWVYNFTNFPTVNAAGILEAPLSIAGNYTGYSAQSIANLLGATAFKITTDFLVPILATGVQAISELNFNFEGASIDITLTTTIDSGSVGLAVLDTSGEVSVATTAGFLFGALNTIEISVSANQLLLSLNGAAPIPLNVSVAYPSTGTFTISVYLSNYGVAANVPSFSNITIADGDTTTSNFWTNLVNTTQT